MTQEQLAQGVVVHMLSPVDVQALVNNVVEVQRNHINNYLQWSQCPEGLGYWEAQYFNPSQEGIELFKRKLAAAYNIEYKGSVKPKIVTKFTKWVQEHEAV